jgi:DNA sulfur modification protein DndD
LNGKLDKNISLITGKNGFGKTSFLTSLIWAFYGKMMSQVEDKYRREIRDSGGYEEFLNSLVNNRVKTRFSDGLIDEAVVEVSIQLTDVLIPSVPCNDVVIRRSFDLVSNKESLTILIDGAENELTKEVGYEVFINDFILPREIAKFFFFDAEKIVSLAEARSRLELKSLSRAYSEVLGIKKYEDLKESLTSYVSKLRRRGVEEEDSDSINALTKKESDLNALLDHNIEKQKSIQKEIDLLEQRTDQIQEMLIREGNSITLDELVELKKKRDKTQDELKKVKEGLVKLLDLVPFAMAGVRIEKLKAQVESELNQKSGAVNEEVLMDELISYSLELKKKIKTLKLDKNAVSSIHKALDSVRNDYLKSRERDKTGFNVLLDLSQEEYRVILATISNLKDSFQVQFKSITDQERNVRHRLTQIIKKIKQAEARKDNPLATKLREEMSECSVKIKSLIGKKFELSSEEGQLRLKISNSHRILSEIERKAELANSDKRKYEVSKNLINKLDTAVGKIKEEKRYALQKSILFGLKKLMHKREFITEVEVKLDGDVMDIDLLDSEGQVIDKNNLSKGEQQLYATALLKALVDESGINFPVFIDSPLQKFDKEHSTNVIEQFYPSISDQVVLLPLLEKELSKSEFKLLQSNLNTIYLIANDEEGSTFMRCNAQNVFTKFNQQNYVQAHTN